MTKKINLAIPIAGKSKRFIERGFNTHKAFLDLDKGFVLKNIIDTFPKDVFRPIIVCTKEQEKEYKSYLDLIKKNYPDLYVKSINSHNFGPTYSLRQLEVQDESPFVVHYCDFLVDMNYEPMVRGLREGLIYAPYFRGFHPASLGSTTFAYMKLNSNKLLITLKEKSSFTDNRIEEPCSTGIYAFPSFGIFKELADELLNNPDQWGQKEAYTSLCMNLAVEKGYRVFCNEVNKFICLGTPRDYEEYLFWNKQFKNFYRPSENQFIFDNHVLTAAGKGSRFRKYGYRIPKIFLDFQNQSFLEIASSSVNAKKTSIVSLEIYKKIIKKFTKNKVDSENFFINKTPNGQLYTLYEYIKAKGKLKNLLVSSADYKFGFSSSIFKELLNKKNPDVIIFTTAWKEFVCEDVSNYGFVQADRHGRVESIIEKPITESENIDKNSLLIGTFWFNSSDIVNKIMNNNHSKEELYIAKTIGNYLSELKVYKLNVDFWLSLGTPKELHLAEYWFDYFSNRE